MSEFKTTDIAVENGPDVTVDIAVRGDDKEAETVQLYAHDAAVRALQAFAHRQDPDECNGIRVGVNWERAFEIVDKREGGAGE